jgi:hypothetical protein
MKIKNLTEGLNAQQSSVPQLPAKAQAQHISVLGAKKDPKHPFAGYAVGAAESAEPGRKRIGPDRNDPWEQGWRANPAHADNPYEQGTKEHAQWADGQAERRAQPRHYDEGVTEGKGLAKKVKIVKGPDTGKTGWIREIKRGAFKGAAKSYYIDLDDGGQANNIPGTALRLIKDPGVAEGRAGVDDTDTVGFSVNSEAAYTAVMKRFGDVIDHDETSGIMYAPAGVWPKIEMVAYDADGEGAVRVEDDMMEAERNEMDTAAVQAALAKMAERHKGEKWTKEQLVALRKRIAARGQKPVKEDDVEDFLARGGKITQVKPNRGPRYPGTSLGSKHIGTLRGGRSSSISGKSANTRPTVKPVVAVESITKEDIISKLKARLGDYLSDISKEIKKDPDLVDKLSAKAPGDQMGPPVKTVTTDDGHEIQIHGNEDDGFRVSIKNRPANTKFKNLDEAVMACEIFCARRRNGQADYLDEA